LDSSVVDVAQGLRTWSNLQTYRDYLRRFASSYSPAVAEMHALLAADNRLAAAALAHKLAGVAANMALPDTYRLASEAERVLAMGYDPIPVLNRLDDAIRQALAVIARFAPSAAPPDATDPAAPVLDAPEIRQALQAHLPALLEALDTDNPAPVEALLDALAKQMPGPDLAALRACVRAFDFRGAEALSHLLARQYGMTFKE
jgi:HPt (histidine-containing phosphotransfer) domain-containing protein